MGRALKGKLQTTEERNRKRLQKTERSSMFVDWQNQHSKNSYTIENNIHVQIKSHKIPNDILHRLKNQP
jgi:hypothetical protein